VVGSDERFKVLIATVGQQTFWTARNMILQELRGRWQDIEKMLKDLT